MTRNTLNELLQEYAFAAQTYHRDSSPYGGAYDATPIEGDQDPDVYDRIEPKLWAAIQLAATAATLGRNLADAMEQIDMLEAKIAFFQRHTAPITRYYGCGCRVHIDDADSDSRCPIHGWPVWPLKTE